MFAIVKRGKGDVRMSGYSLMPYGDDAQGLNALLFNKGLCAHLKGYLFIHKKKILLSKLFLTI